MSRNSIEVRSNSSSCCSKSVYICALPPLGIWAVPRAVRSGNVVGKGGLKGWAEGSAVVSSLGFQIAGVSRVDTSEAGRRLRVEPMGVITSDEMLHLRECTCTLPGQQYVHHVRTASPLQQATVVEVPLPCSRVSRRAQAQEPNGFQGLTEHAYRFDDPDHRRV